MSTETTPAVVNGLQPNGNVLDDVGLKELFHNKRETHFPFQWADINPTQVRVEEDQPRRYSAPPPTKVKTSWFDRMAGRTPVEAQPVDDIFEDSGSDEDNKPKVHHVAVDGLAYLYDEEAHSYFVRRDVARLVTPVIKNPIVASVQETAKDFWFFVKKIARKGEMRLALIILSPLAIWGLSLVAMKAPWGHIGQGAIHVGLIVGGIGVTIAAMLAVVGLYWLVIPRKPQDDVPPPNVTWFHTETPSYSAGRLNPSGRVFADNSGLNLDLEATSLATHAKLLPMMKMLAFRKSISRVLVAIGIVIGVPLFVISVIVPAIPDTVSLGVGLGIILFSATGQIWASAGQDAYGYRLPSVPYKMVRDAFTPVLKAVSPATPSVTPTVSE